MLFLLRIKPERSKVKLVSLTLLFVFVSSQSLAETLDVEGLWTDTRWGSPGLMMYIEPIGSEFAIFDLCQWGIDENGETTSSLVCQYVKTVSSAYFLGEGFEQTDEGSLLHKGFHIRAGLGVVEERIDKPVEDVLAFFEI
jgi:hypothetical protein